MVLTIIGWLLTKMLDLLWSGSKRSVSRLAVRFPYAFVRRSHLKQLEDAEKALHVLVQQVDAARESVALTSRKRAS